jgi:signal transduction histidine kinase
MRRLGCFIAVVALLAVAELIALVSIVVGWLAGGRGESGQGAWLIALLAIAVLFAVLRLVPSMRRFAGPLDDLSAAAQRVEQGDYSARVRVPLRSPRQLRDLVRTFNTMTERLALDEEQRRDLLANVSHELRTPLAVIRGEVEAILDGVHTADTTTLGVVLEEIAVLSRLIEDLRVLTLSEAGTLPLYRESTDLVELVSTAVAAFRAAAESAGVALTFTTTVVDAPAIDVDPVRLREVVNNLLQNALRHTPAGGAVAVRVTLDSDRFTIDVADKGVGVEPQLLPRIFDRFVKDGESRGTGLGLPIARYLVEAHGGTLTAASSVGVGTTLTVTLPTGHEGR